MFSIYLVYYYVIYIFIWKDDWFTQICMNATHAIPLYVSSGGSYCLLPAAADETFIFNIYCVALSEGCYFYIICNQPLCMAVFAKTFPLHFGSFLHFLIDRLYRYCVNKTNITNWLSMNMTTHVSNYKIYSENWCGSLYNCT